MYQVGRFVKEVAQQFNFLVVKDPQSDIYVANLI